MSGSYTMLFNSTARIERTIRPEHDDGPAIEQTAVRLVKT